MVMVFGKGDIIVSDAYHDKEMKTEPYMMFFKADAGKVGSRPEFKGRCVDGDLKMFFDKVESIDAVIDSFLGFKKRWVDSKKEDARKVKDKEK